MVSPNVICGNHADEMFIICHVVTTWNYCVLLFNNHEYVMSLFCVVCLYEHHCLLFYKYVGLVILKYEVSQLHIFFLHETFLFNTVYIINFLIVEGFCLTTEMM